MSKDTTPKRRGVSPIRLPADFRGAIKGLLAIPVEWVKEREAEEKTAKADGGEAKP